MLLLDETPGESLSGLIGIIEAVETSDDFTQQYDEAVDAVETALVDRALQALQTLDVEGALGYLGQAVELRDRYFTLLEGVAAEPDHPMSPSLPRLRGYAEEVRALLGQFATVLRAFATYKGGDGPSALRQLEAWSDDDRPTTTEIGSVAIATVQITSHMLAASIRAAALDHAGARAAYDRAAAYADLSMREVERWGADAPDLSAGVRYQLLYSEAHSFLMQHHQFITIGDYDAAVGSARAAAAKQAEAADTLEQAMPTLAPLLRGQSFEWLALASEAESTVAIEQMDWQQAEESARAMRQHYEKASRACLSSGLPIANMFQERYLNAGFVASVRLRRRLHHERSQAERIATLQEELRSFIESVRSALSPSGVVVNNANEMVSTVQQQVEITRRLETNVRALLRELPGALEESSLPLDAQRDLQRNALMLADDRTDGATFLGRAKAFAADLSDIVSKGSETGTRLLGLLKALSVLD